LNKQTIWMAEAGTTNFDPFLSVVWECLRAGNHDLPESVPTGIGDIPFNALSGGYAIDKDGRFAAIQWYEPAKDKDELLRIETFFVCPSSTKPRACLRITAPDSIEEIVAPDWWTTTFPGSALTTSHKLPTFLELVSILASKGNVSTSSADMAIALSESEHEKTYFKKLSEDLAEDLRQARARLRNALKLRNEIADANAFQQVEADEQLEITDLSGIPEWAEKNADRIVIHSRAINSSKKSKYQNPAAIYASLELLAGPYREHRSGLITKDEFLSAMAAAGVKIEGSIGATPGKHADSYYVMFEGRRRMLDFHVEKGGGRDERYCMRIYFFWDADLKKAVVGWMPSHLDNTLT
jgi:hypothetical protein